MHMHTRYRPATAALAAITGLLLAGCGASAASSSGSTSSTGTSGSATASAAAMGSSAVVPASALAFPVAVGNTWVYTSIVPSAKTASTVTDKVLSVLPATDGSHVTESFTSSLSSRTVKSTYIFHRDGSITFPLSEVSGGTLVNSNGGILLPNAAAIASGRPHKSVVTLTFTENGQKVKETAHITVEGAGTAMVTVPAGTYQATVVDMTMAWTEGPVKVKIQITDWFANGTGTVKSQALLNENAAYGSALSEVISTQELKSFIKG
jgi:hypothetical protein